MFGCLQTKVLMFNRLHASWPEDYHIGSLEKSHRIRNYLKPMQKSYPSTGFKPEAYGLPVQCSYT